MTPEAEARAKELFFAYDGSSFYMSRDGADEEFEALDVSRDTQREWMRELTAKHLAALDEPGNWRTLNFLSHHSDYSHVSDVLAARPLGVWWEQVAFLEESLRYVRTARWLLKASGSDLARAAAITLEYGQPLLASARQGRLRGPGRASVAPARSRRAASPQCAPPREMEHLTAQPSAVGDAARGTGPRGRRACDTLAATLSPTRR